MSGTHGVRSVMGGQGNIHDPCHAKTGNIHHAPPPPDDYWLTPKLGALPVCPRQKEPILLP